MPTYRSPGLQSEYCRFLTRDGLELQGLLARPSRKTASALVHVHGWDGNFYENRFIDYAARTAVKQGLGFFAFNNRGHDYVADIIRVKRKQKAEVRRQKSEGPERFDCVQVGGIYERLADCVPDIQGAFSFLHGHGFRRFILQGHSHGAIKAAYYLSETRDPRVTGLVLLSPSDDLALGRQQMGKRFGTALGRARRMVRTGKERQLIPPDLYPYMISAGTFTDCFGPDSITGMFNLSRTDRKESPELARIRVPLLMVVGTVEEAFVGDAEEFVRSARLAMSAAQSFGGAVIHGAPHNYLGYERRLSGILGRWLARRQ